MSERSRIAVVGIGCRFPGGADSPDAFWRLLEAGADVIGPMPAGRFDVDRFVHPEPGTPGRMVTADGGFLPDIDRFDAAFFGLSPREARKIDPQHRLLLEVAWEALEDAGIPPSSLAGRRVGVYVGVWSGEYENVMYRTPADLDFHSITGGGRYAASGRISYALDLRGPALTVDTGCSASLVALHLARQAILNGDCDLAIVGAANLVLQPHVNIGYSRSGMLSVGGRCRFGDAGAAGYVRSDGAAAVVLKPLDAAIADRDRVRGVVLATAVNADGRGSGQLATPSIDAQAALLEQVYAAAGVDPASVPYVEAHGTGTRAGDPVEVEALGRVLGKDRPGAPLLVGSVKTNIGHTEAAAGMAGLIKTLLALEHRRIPANLHLREKHEAIRWDELHVEVPTAARDWPAGAPLYAGVSSFGITGTNAHAVVAAAPRRTEETAEETPMPRVIAVSGASPEALNAAASNLRAFLHENATIPLSDISYTTTVRRDHHAHRLALVAETVDEVVAALDAHAAGEATASISTGESRGEAPAIGFVFSGQGSQWLGMARGLLGRAPVFTATLERLDPHVQALANWSVRAVLLGDDPQPLERVEIIQPTLTCVQIALADQLRAWGVLPRAVVGHSMGEVAAAYIAGALSLEDAVRVIVTRSRLLAEIAGAGAMALVDLDEAETAKLIVDVSDRVSIAAVNGPRSTVISGDPAIIDDLLEKLDDEGVFCRRVKVDVASHSPQTEPLLPHLAAELAALKPQIPAIPFYSTPRPGAPTDALLDAAYWVDNLRKPVQLKAAVQAMIADGIDTFIEVAPHPVLLSSLADIAADANAAVRTFAGPRRDEPEMRRVLDLLAKLHVIGVPVAWKALADEHARVLRLPTYPWQRERHWLERWEDWSGDGSSAVASPRPENLGDVAYVIDWRPLSLLPVAKGRGDWIIVGGASPIAQELLSLIRAVGESAALVTDAGALEDVAMKHGGVLAGVIDLRSLSARGAPFDRVLEQGVDAIAGTIEKLEAVRARPAVGTWFVTAGVHGPGDRKPDPDGVPQAAVWGFARTAAPEHPDLKIGLVDLDPAAAASSAARQLWAAINNGSETQLAVDGDSVYTARMIRAASTMASKPAAWRTDCSYLVTGGLGEIGLRVAEEMIRQGARRLVLSGRTQVPPREQWSSLPSGSALAQKLAAVRRLESMGASIHLASFDVADERQLAAFLARFQAEGWPPIRGVVHCAGVIETGVTGREAFQSIMAGKAIGAYNLHEQLPDLDHLILFSSIASVLPQSLGYYAAANAVLDALACVRRAHGQPGISLSWGVWSDAGMAGNAVVSRYVRIVEQRGISAFSVDEAKALFAWVANAEVPHLILTKIDWSRASTALAYTSAGFYSELVAATSSGGSSRGETILALPVAQRRTAMADFVRSTIARVLQLPTSAIHPTVPFGKQGLDSLMAVEFRNRLETELGLRLPASLAWNYPTIGVLADHLLEQITHSTGGEEAAPMTDAETPVAGAQRDDRVEALLATIEDESEENVLRMLRGGVA